MCRVNLALAFALTLCVVASEAHASGPIDVLFVIDSSSSTGHSDGVTRFDMERAGVNHLLCSPQSPIPRDGTVRVGILHFGPTVHEVAGLTLLYQDSDAEHLCAALAAIDPLPGTRLISKALDKAREMFEAAASDCPRDRLVILMADDSGPEGELHHIAMAKAQALRALRPPAHICTLSVTDDPPCAMTWPYSLADSDQSPCHDPTQYGSDHYCATCEHGTEFDLSEFDSLGAACICPIVNQDGEDCNRNGTPDICEAHPIGGCCHGVAGQCTDLTEACCNAVGGHYLGDENMCEWQCDFLGGACSTQSECWFCNDAQRGFPLCPDGICADGFSCVGLCLSFKCQTGACCEPANGVCRDYETNDGCIASWSQFAGYGTQCDAGRCPIDQHQGAGAMGKGARQRANGQHEHRGSSKAVGRNR